MDQRYDSPPEHDPTLTAATPTAGSAPEPFVPGQLVDGRFRILARLAEGGMGVVYLALDTRLNQKRALKCARSGFAAHLTPETRSALRVTHPNVCRVFEMHSASTPEGVVDFLAMEFVEGPTLAARLRAQPPLPPAEARTLALQICAGLHAAHQTNLLHRDLKPANIMLARDTSGAPRAVVMDFGLARERSAAPADGAGTPGYLAPELLRGARPSIASDIYALGLVLQQLDTSRRCRKVAARCLHPDPARRFSSAAAVAITLAGHPLRRRVIAAAAAAAALLAAVLYVNRPIPTPPARLALFPLEANTLDPSAQALVRGASYDLSNRLSRLRPRPPQLVVIPIEETRAAPTPALARARLGATHALTGSVTLRNGRLALRGAIIDTSTQLPLRELNSGFDPNDTGSLASSLAALAAAAFHLPRQTAPESVAPAAYRSYAEGMAQLRSGSSHAVQAAAAFERAVQLDPRSALPRAALAEALYTSWTTSSDPSLLVRARHQLDEAARLNPDSLAVHLAAGKLNLAPGSYERAAREFQRALDLDPLSAEAWRGLALSLENMPERASDAASAYLKAIEVQPGYPAPLTDLGIFYRRRGNYAEAEKHWRRVVQFTPQSPSAHVNLGGLLTDMGRYPEAQRELDLALSLDPRSRPALNNLGALALYLGQDAQAASYFERARAAGPESDILLLNLGDACRRTGRASQAAEAYRRGHALSLERLLNNPRDAVARAFVAYFLLRLGQPAQARAELAQALSLDPLNKSVLRRAVLTYEALNDRAAALAVLDAAPPDLVHELSRQPDLAKLRQDPSFPKSSHN